MITDSLKRASWLELLYDLAFVALVAQLTYLAAAHLDSFMGFAHVFIIGYTVFITWWSTTVNRNLQEREGFLDRILIQVQLVGAFMMSLAMPAVFAGDYTTYFITLALLRLLQVFMMLRMYRLHPEHNPKTKNVVQGIAIAAGLWFVSALVPDPYHLVVAGAALLLDILTPLTKGKGNSVRLLSIHHLQERLGLFFMLVLGESLLVVALANTALKVETAPLVLLLSGVLAVVALWWLYFDFLEREGHDQRPKQFFVFVHAHGFLFGAIVLLAAAIKVLLEGKVEAVPVVWLYLGALLGIVLCLYVLRAALLGMRASILTLWMWLSMVIGGVVVSGVLVLVWGIGLYLIPTTTAVLLFTAALDVWVRRGIVRS